MMHYDNKDVLALLQMKSKKYLRMKVTGCLYRSDLLLIFAMVVVFSFTFNLLSWLHEPPDGTKIDLSQSRQEVLINEWKQKYLELERERQKKNGAAEVKGDVHENNNDHLEDDDSDAIKKYGSDDNVDGVIDSKKRDGYKYEFDDFDEGEAAHGKEEKLLVRDFEVDIIKKDFDDYNALYVLHAKQGQSSNTKKDLTKGGRDSRKDDRLLDLRPLNVAAPVGGKLVGGPAQCTLYNIDTPISADYECLNIAIKPIVKVCLYPTVQDVHISQHIRNVGIWEPHIVKEFQNILFSNPEYGVIDLGANIGLYSLIAARMGHEVVSVEPYKENLYHFHKAVNIGGFADKITAVRNVVSDVRKNYVPLWVDPENQGGIQIDKKNKNPCIHENCTKTVKSIYMDDLLEVINFKKAVMKMDIEGHEHRALTRSAALFDKVYISHIIMEWMQLRGYYGAEATQNEDKDLVHQTVVMLHRRGYKAYSLVTGIELKPEYWFSWPDDIIWKHELEAFN